MPCRTWMRHWWPALIVPALVLAVAAGAWISGYRPSSWLLSNWQAELENAGPPQAVVLLTRMAELNDDGLAQVVDAMSDSRETISLSASQALGEQLARWRLLSPQESFRRAKLLANLLADRSDAGDPGRMKRAADLALRLLLWPQSSAGESNDRAQMVADCQRVLTAAASKPSINPAPQTNIALFQEGLPNAADPRLARQEGVLANRATPAAFVEGIYLPGGNLPIEPALPTLPAADHALSAPPIDAIGLPPGRSGPVEKTSPNEQRTPGEPRRLVHGDEAIPLTGTRGSAPRDTSANSPAQIGSSLSEHELIQRLRDPDGPIAASAQAELTKRGFQPVHFRIALQLTDPDSNARRALAEALPRMEGVEARSWLLALAIDEAPEVRLAAITVLATSNDPTVLPKLRALRAGESDDRVAEQLDRALRVGDRR